MLENMAFYMCEMDHSRNKTQFQGVKLIFDPENKRTFPKKQVQNVQKWGFFSKKSLNVKNVQLVLCSFEKC